MPQARGETVVTHATTRVRSARRLLQRLGEAARGARGAEARREAADVAPRAGLARRSLRVPQEVTVMMRLRGPSKTLVYLAAAGAMYAWRSYGQTKQQRTREGARPDDDGAPDEAGASAFASAGSDRDSEPAGREQPRNYDDGGEAGITTLPPSEERAQQDALPPRGERKPGYHA
jgi:hypothetical protein